MRARMSGAEIRWFVAALLLATCLYLPGIRGTFVFDDYPNIVDNADLHVTTLDPQAWIKVLWASPSSDLQRPLASLSFAANHYFTGLDPMPMKLTNVALHLLNGWLLFVLLQRICAFAAHGHTGVPSRWLPLLVATLWLVHPINLSAVLYVVQRMESLAQLFVLVGLLFYLDARRRQVEDRPGAWWRLWLAVPLCTALGVAAKESAALLPLLALVLELTLLHKRSHNRASVARFFLLFLVLPGVLGALWVIPRMISHDAYAFRAFTLGQRLLTEPRVLLDYVAWTLLPAPDFFSFYHDDYPISIGPFQPWSTLPAIAILAAVTVFAWRLRARRPLVALGWGWFLAAHVLTATVIPLELVFEHRNYFASIGLLLAASDLLLPRTSEDRLTFPRIAVAMAIVALASVSLALRSLTWGNPVKFAVTEAARHPQSPRATYELGHTYVVLSGYQKDSPNLPKAMEALEVAARAPRASTLPEVGLIMTASRSGLPIKQGWWDGLVAKLTQHAPTPEDSSALASLTDCQRSGRCNLDDERMLQIYLAASAHEPADPSVLYSYAIFAFNRLEDTELALRLARDAAKSRDPQYQLNLVNFLLDIGRYDEARIELDALRKRVRIGSMTAELHAAAQRLAEGSGAVR
jgi:tetratricopeptide (TPR) repeat protein